MQSDGNVTRLMLLLAVIASSTNGLTQQKRRLFSLPGATSVQGELTVTATVIASVGIIFDANGVPTLMEANLPNHSDNVSRLQPTKADPNRALKLKASGSSRKRHK